VVATSSMDSYTVIVVPLPAEADGFERIRLGTFQKHGRFLKDFDLS
jgi:hypothetical protein